MNIFFTGSIRGGRADQPRYSLIVKILERYGTVLSRHIQDEELSQYGETNLSAKEILERERGTLAKSDIVVAEVTTPSLGVGYLIAMQLFPVRMYILLLHPAAQDLDETAGDQGHPA